MKTLKLLTSVFLCVSCVGVSVGANAQCGIPTLPVYPACGSRGQTQLANNSFIIFGDYYYSGGAATFGGVVDFAQSLYICGTAILTSPTLFGGTIVVEAGGNLTINNNGALTSGVEIVNYGSLTINTGSAANVFTSNAVVYNYGSVNIIGALTMGNEDALYNAGSAASMVVSGNLLTNGAVVNAGDVTVKGTYSFKSTLCLVGGSQMGVNKLDQTGTSRVTVQASASGVTTATIGITTSLTTTNSLTTTSDLVLCEGPGFTAGGNAGSATIDHNCTLSVLPITLISFSASAENNICALQWTTAKQVGLVNFEIQSSTDAVNYETLAMVPAEQETTDYSYTTAITANTWFRLKMVNQDGSFAYSAVAPVTYQGGAAGEAYVLRIQPNLITGNTLQVWSNMSSAQSGEWQVVDMMGRTLMHQPAQLNAGTTTNTIQLPGLFSGMYRLLFVGSQVRVSPVPFSVIR